MQQYFKSGKTIVIDDQYNEAKPLLDALTKSQIPFFYSQGKPNSDFPLPNTDQRNAQYYNLVFMDLNLDFKFAGSQIGNENEEKTFKGTHAQILNTIIKNKNRSFVLVIWSNEEENYFNHYKQLFDDLKYTSKRPYKIISLSKPTYFSLTETGYEFKKDEHGATKPFEDLLFTEINKALEDLEGFKLFCEWDRVVSLSVGDTVDDFMSLINDMPTEGEREQHLAEILTSISIAYSGKEGFLQLVDNEEKTDSVFLALTQVLNDDIDRNVLNNRQKEFTNWRASNKKEIDVLLAKVDPALINKKLLIFNPNKTNLTGSVYKLKVSPPFLKRTLKDCINTDSAFKKVKKNLNFKYKKGFENEQNNDSKSHAFLQFIESECIPIEINITPLCDIVQDKFINYRIVVGFIAPAYFNDCIKNSDLAFFCKSPIFPHNSKDYFIGIDFRSFTSCTKEEIEDKEYLFSLRTNLINDIQTKLAAHVSRLGVLNL